jgi:branched-chain amino acid transport system ATP-binding protein
MMVAIHITGASMQRGFTSGLNSSHLEPGEVQLKVDNIQLNFGGVTALLDVSMEVRQSEILAIIGPNGAGKTSLLNCISGLYHPQRGSIVYMNGKEHEITRMKPHQIARLGIARSFQNIELFRHMTVLDNLLAGAHVHMRSSLLSGLIYWKSKPSVTIRLAHFRMGCKNELRWDAPWQCVHRFCC